MPGACGGGPPPRGRVCRQQQHSPVPRSTCGGPRDCLVRLPPAFPVHRRAAGHGGVTRRPPHPMRPAARHPCRAPPSGPAAPARRRPLLPSPDPGTRRPRRLIARLRLCSRRAATSRQRAAPGTFRSPGNERRTHPYRRGRGRCAPAHADTRACRIRYNRCGPRPWRIHRPPPAADGPGPHDAPRHRSHGCGLRPPQTSSPCTQSRRDLVRVHVVLLRQLGDRLVAPERLQCDTRLERRGMVSSWPSLHGSAPPAMGMIYSRPSTYFIALSEKPEPP